MSAKFVLFTLFFGISLLLCSACSTTDPNWRAPVETRTAAPSATVQTKPARPQPAKASPINPSTRYYHVQPGDTLFSIAWRSDNDVQQLAHWNKLPPPYVIYPRQRIQLFAPAKPISQPHKPVALPPPTKPVAPAKPVEPVAPIKPVASAKPPPVDSPVKPTQPKSLDWRWPLEGKLASTFKKGDALRKGIKIIGKPGEPVRAAEAGRVVYSGRGLIGYGLLIIIKHNHQYLSAYGHNRKLLVQQGQQVVKGEKIAELGATNAGESQLHFEIRRKGKPVNPLQRLPQRTH